MADTATITALGPEHNGMRMSLAEFANLDARAGYTCELEKGVVIVVQLADLPHGLIVQYVRNRFVIFQAAHPDTIFFIGGGGEAGLQMQELQSQRHPDISVYLSRPPLPAAQPWDFWAPDIAIEVVSPASRDRDYHIKREEYLIAGVRFYWIIDPDRSATLLTRRLDHWEEQRLDETAVITTTLLPGLELKLADAFAAAE